MKKSKLGPDVDVYQDDDLIIYDTRENKKVMPTVGVEIENGISYLKCLICNWRTRNKEEFMQHRCKVEGGQ